MGCVKATVRKEEMPALAGIGFDAGFPIFYIIQLILKFFPNFFARFLNG